ncbi:ubiquitin-like small modifier protein 1 [Natrialba asiatica]|uniref:Sulfur carrier protein ThiS n=1 Tax=Natrialba asiatica (strain ATCC 700177 / DSM 12278 / JCM 9576 / FERM P-10747 / NBRC 102637 / 172P1) TaxID=29540 RepID=M0B3V1_NATA1|nr:ubiquitin-like small modifier protein 1 [Natrialba asiatica]ELZ05571.1 sulfur carrier protein ThiS [Natrialba asiatica DSM 12278]
MQVIVYGPLRSATGEKTVEVDHDGETVADALAAFVEQYPRAKSQLYSDDGKLRGSVRVSVDGDRSTPDDQCPTDASVSVYPAIQGG